MGFSTADQTNPTPMLSYPGSGMVYQPDQMNPEGLPPGVQVGFGTPNPNFDDSLGMNTPGTATPGTATPGMGGKGGVAGDPAMSAQAGMNIPQVPTMNPPQTGLPGLPVPVAPMTPLGPGLGNPGGPGVQPQQRIAPPAPMPPVATPFNPNQQQKINPFALQNKMMPNRNAPPGPSNNMARPMLINRNGAGRGGMIR